MSKKNAGVNNAQAKEVNTAKTTTNGRIDFAGIKPMHIIICIIVLSLLIYARALNFPLVNFDDTGYITYNELIKSLSGPHLLHMLVKPVMGNYHPVTVFSYALEYALKQEAPAIYHLDNLILHILASILAYYFLARLTANNMVAAIGAILFAAHPMHVESVVWVADRKDLLYTSFFLGALICYLRYISPGEKGKNKKYYFICLLLFVAALMSKAVAVTLPVVLLLIDAYKMRQRSANLIVEKIPFFMLSAIAGFLAIKAQAGINAIDITREHFNVAERSVLGFYALGLYLKQFLLPFNQVCLYVYPAKVNGHLPYIYFIYAVLCIAVFVAVILKYKGQKNIPIGIFFFVVTIAPLLQFIPVGNAIIADRYTYLPYLGLFLAASSVIAAVLKTAKAAQSGQIGLVIYIAVLTFLSFQQVSIWKDDITLWTRSVSVYPDNAFSQNQLGSSYVQLGLASMNTGEKVNAMNYYNSGLEILQKASRLILTQPGALPQEKSLIMNNLGLAFAGLGQNDSAIWYFSQAISAFPGNLGAYTNRGKQYIAMKDYQRALADYKALITHDKENDEAYYMAGACAGMLNDFNAALAFFNRSLELNPDNPQYYVARAKAYQHLGNKAAADADIFKAQTMQSAAE